MPGLPLRLQGGEQCRQWGVGVTENIELRCFGRRLCRQPVLGEIFRRVIAQQAARIGAEAGKEKMLGQGQLRMR